MLEIRPFVQTAFVAERLDRTRSFSFLMDQKETAWQKLCALYLPIAVSNSIWRFSRPISSDDPEQGWKIHVSATILSAETVLKRVGPFLRSEGVLFKAPVSLLELKKLNCGLYDGFSQVGKCITVYTRGSEEAVFLANRLHRLTYKLASPDVPYDLRFRENSCVYYRYGSFRSLEMKSADGTLVPAIRDPEGTIVPDLREPGKAIPKWADDPFKKPGRQKTRRVDSPLRTTIQVYEALSQRGKGGVYRALDLTTTPARLCILKEGRLHGETDIDGRDGSWRIRYEAQVLRSLFRERVGAPEVYMEFETEGNYYVAMEFIEGQNLQALLSQAQRKLPINQALTFGIKIAGILVKIHRLGWAWRDCKPLNLILTKGGQLRPVDFEGACLLGVPEPLPWGTTGYIPPEWLDPNNGSRVPEDLYAFGATLHQLLTGVTPSSSAPSRIGTLRRGIPRLVREVISALLDSDPQSRPGACEVLRTLELVVAGDTSRS